MKLKSLLLLVTVLAVSPQIAKAGWFTGNKLNQTCNSNSMFELGRCNGFIVGVVDSFDRVEFCTPNNATAGQLEDIVKKYMREYPEELHRAGDFIVIRAMIRAFPCHKK